MGSHALVEIDELDPTDAAARTAWHDVMERAVRADRPHALTTTLAAFEVTATSPSTYYDRTWLRAVVDGEVVGVAELELPLTENTDVAWGEVQVLAATDDRASAARCGTSSWSAPVPQAGRASGER